jgi:hypothetical protein
MGGSSVSLLSSWEIWVCVSFVQSEPTTPMSNVGTKCLLTVLLTYRLSKKAYPNFFCCVFRCDLYLLQARRWRSSRILQNGRNLPWWKQHIHWKLGHVCWPCIPRQGYLLCLDSL